jgi:hypothetical protein
MASRQDVLFRQPGQNIPAAARSVAPVATHPTQCNGPAAANLPVIRALLPMTMINHDQRHDGHGRESAHGRRF